MADYAIHEETLVDVSNVIRKKDGTVALIDPADYADRINLMGMLEEKTASGSIAHIEDGADRVPIKSWEVEITPTLTGVSEVECAQAGSNLWDEEWEEGLISASDGQDTPSDQYSRTKNYISVKPSSSVYLYFGVTRIYLRRYGKDKGYLGYAQINTSSIWNVPSDTYYIRFCWDGTTYNDDISVNYPSTETAYQYSTIATVSTVNLGRTVYGGEVDIVNGVGTDETNKFTVTSDMSNSIRYIGSGNTAYIQINKPPASNGRWQDLVCSHFTPANIYAGGTQQGIGCYSTQFYIRDSRFTSKQDFLDFLTEQETLGTPLEICYKLATPETFTFTPITPTPETALGVNNFWADEGDSEVTYRGQGTVTVYPNAEETSF